jgi:hypothetical protein
MLLSAKTEYLAQLIRETIELEMLSQHEQRRWPDLKQVLETPYAQA